MDGRSDENLVFACRAGDKDAYAILIERHYKHIFLVCFGMLGNVHDAEDVAQDTILKAFLQIKKLRDGSRFGAWISTIARNLCINFLKKQERASRVTAAKAEEAVQTPMEDEGLQEAIEKLASEMRLPLVMYYFDGQDVKTVAERLKLSSSAVYLKLRTATRQLHKLLTEQGDER